MVKMTALSTHRHHALSIGLLTSVLLQQDEKPPSSSQWCPFQDRAGLALDVSSVLRDTSKYSGLMPLPTLSQHNAWLIPWVWAAYCTQGWLEFGMEALTRHYVHLHPQIIHGGKQKDVCGGKEHISAGFGGLYL